MMIEQPYKLGKMICFHTRYNLGDNHEFNHENYSSWAELGNAIAKFYNAGVILPLYMLDHSNLVVSTHPFFNKWDSGQIGFIVASKKDITDYFMTTYCTKLCKKEATEILLNEVDEYNSYLNDDYEVEYDNDDGC